jgi:hypothetical protein
VTVVFAHVEPDEAPYAYQWHRGFAAANQHIYPRVWSYYKQLADKGQLVCAREDGQYVGLCYYTLDDHSREWEVGGMMVAASQRQRGLGATLACVTVGHLLINQDPLGQGENVISHVQGTNKLPRRALTDLFKFTWREESKVPGSELPGLPQDKDGFVVSDVFEISNPGSLLVLADWCDGWNGQLLDGSPAVIETFVPLDDWATAFRAMAN